MNSIEENWIKFLHDVIEKGEKHTKDDGDVLQEHLINHCFIDNVLNQFGAQNITAKMFIDMIKKGVFDIEGYPLKGPALADYVQSFDDPKQIYLEEYDEDDKPFIYTYPERIRNIYLCNRRNHKGRYNQFEIMQRRLMEHAGSNRAVATLYSAGLDKDEQHIPCLNWMQATIRNNELILHVIFRSNDCYSAFPSNMLFIQYIGIKLVEELKEFYPLLKFKGISYQSSSLHIYEGDLDQAKKVIGVE
jgi:thymidylate synthase